MKKGESVLDHALRMIRRNRRTYIRLTVSLVLSFTTIFGVFLYYDSLPFHQNKDILKQPSYLTKVMVPDNMLRKRDEKVKKFLKRVEQVPNTRILPLQVLVPPKENSFLGGVTVEYFAYPKSFGEMPMDFSSYPWIFKPADGSQSFEDIESIMLTPTTYHTLKAIGEIEGDQIELYLPDRQGNWRRRSRKIQSTLDMPELIPDVNLTQESFQGNLRVFLARESLPPNIDNWVKNEFYFIYSDYATDIADLARQNEMIAATAASVQPVARQAMRNAIQLKTMVASLVFILLTWNLNGSFANALKERRYEIGLRRSLGASPRDIIKQFTAEATVVILLSAVLSFLIAVAGFYLIRLFFYIAKKEVLTIFLQPTSFLIMSLMTLSIVLILSLAFSFQAMNVKIVSALQGGGEN